MKNVGIFGGSFDPIHLGHTGLAQYALRKAGLDEVWLMVSPRNPLKEAEYVATDEQRLEMAHLAVRDLPGIKVSDFEFSLPVPSYTCHTLTSLKEKYPDRVFKIIIGEDNWDDFHRWKNSEFIRREFGVIVYPRPGSQEGTRHLPPDITFLAGAPLMNVSSTQIRTLLRQDAPDRCLRTLLDPAVLEYIKEHKIYGSQN